MPVVLASSWGSIGKCCSGPVPAVCADIVEKVFFRGWWKTLSLTGGRFEILARGDSQKSSVSLYDAVKDLY